PAHVGDDRAAAAARPPPDDDARGRLRDALSPTRGRPWPERLSARRSAGCGSMPPRLPVGPARPVPARCSRRRSSRVPRDCRRRSRVGRSPLPPPPRSRPSPLDWATGLLRSRAGRRAGDRRVADDDFLGMIETEVRRDPHNLALREDFVTLLIGSDPDRAAEELAAFEEVGGDPARVSLLRARLMAARLRGSTAGPPTEPTAADRTPAAADRAPVAEPVPVPSAADGRGGVWDAERPAVTLSDVAGLAEVKQHLETTFLAPLRNPAMAAAFGQTPGGSLLMYGPPGCGKTFIAKAIAGDLGASFIHVTIADLVSKWIGDAERAIQ